MNRGGPGSFGAHLKDLREAAGFTQEELATISGLSVHAVSALERGERRRPHVETVRALSAALDLTGARRESFLSSARSPQSIAAEWSGASLPLPLTALVGRDLESQELRRWLADPAIRLVTLTGAGGVGKTRLVLELVRTIAAEGATRVGFVSLGALASAALVAPAVAEGFGFSDVTVADLPRRVRVACGEQSALLVLDNFEHVLTSAPLVTELLMAVPALKILVTSRAPLRLRGEREYTLGPLTLDPASDALPPADLARSPAVRLFLERVRDVQPDFRLTPANGPTVAAICRRLDALPLALELAAPWIKASTADALLRRLERDALLSPLGSRDLPERQQTMNATVAWSYQLLDADEQRAFRRLGALPGLFPVDAAAVVLSSGELEADEGRALLAIAGLMDKSLLSRAETSAVPTCPLYRMLETVRAFAASELAASGEHDEVMERVARYCMAEAALAADGLIGPRQAEWLDRVREDLPTYRSTLTWLLAQGRSADATSIAWSLFFFWLIRGHGAEGLRWYQDILDMPHLAPAVECRALTGAAIMWYSQGDLTRGRAAASKALGLARASGTSDILAGTQNLLGHLEHASGNLDVARRWFTQSIDAFKNTNLAWGVGNCLSGLAWIALGAGELAEADRLLDEAAAALRPSGPWFGELGLYIRALVCIRRGDADGAISSVRESLVSITELDDKFAFVYALVPLAAAAVMKGDDAWAARILGARDLITERTGAAVLDPSVHDLRERAEQDARGRLGPERWAREYAAGRRTTTGSLLNDIISRSPGASRL